MDLKKNITYRKLESFRILTTCYDLTKKHLILAVLDLDICYFMLCVDHQQPAGCIPSTCDYLLTGSVDHTRREMNFVLSTALPTTPIRWLGLGVSNDALMVSLSINYVLLCSYCVFLMVSSQC